MLRVSVLFLILIFINAGQAASKDLFQLAESQLTSLHRAPVISNEDVEKIWMKIGKYVIEKTNKRYAKLLYRVWTDLVKKNRIRHFTNDIRNELNISKKFCSYENNCHDLVAVYLPLNHMILIDYSELNDEVITWIYHELVHAYQYTYRLPIDVAKIFEFLIRDNEIKIVPEQAIDFLKFYYEAQANWYTLRFSQNQLWLDSGESSWTLLPTSFVKALIALPTGGATIMAGKTFFDPFFPKIDRIEKSTRGYLHVWRGEQLNFHELLILRNASHFFNTGVNIDLSFHYNFSRKIESAYFGSLPFLMQDDGGDQKLFVEMHDFYYETFLERLSSTFDECENLFAKVMSENAPLLQWLSIDSDYLKTCPIVDLTIFGSSRNLFADFYAQGSRGRFFHAGGEGSGGPTLKINPLLHLHPQLIVQPE